MRILLTNDDGINGEGLRTLAAHLNEMADVFIVAPDRERSGTGHGMTVFKPIMAKKAWVREIEAEAWVITGMPVDCVKLAISSLMPEPPDLVISGINHGPNLGTDVLYSGTVSAAVEGVIMGVPSVAVSLVSYKRGADYGFAARFTRAVCRQLMKDEMIPHTIININVPARPRNEIKGARITRLGSRRYDNTYEKRTDPRGNVYFWLGGDVIEESQEKDTDVTAVAEGYVSITPIHFDLTDYRLIEEFRRRYGEYFDHV